MKYLNRLMVSALLLTPILASLSHAEIAVIVSLKNNNSYTSIDKDLVERIFLSKVKNFPDGTVVKPLNLKQGHYLRDEFNSGFLSKTESQLSRYWSRLRFSGKAQLPQEAQSVEEVKALIANNPSLIGYIDAMDVDDTIKIVHKY
jgi:ABC-type phosphate transport system substrate-binding protein